MNFRWFTRGGLVALSCACAPSNKEMKGPNGLCLCARSYIAGVFVLLLSTTPSISKTVDIDPENDINNFVEFVIDINGIDPEFLYCIQDIRFFGKYKSDYCMYTLSKLNILGRKAFFHIEYDDVKTLIEILDRFTSRMERMYR